MGLTYSPTRYLAGNPIKSMGFTFKKACLRLVEKNEQILLRIEWLVVVIPSPIGLARQGERRQK